MALVLELLHAPFVGAMAPLSAALDVVGELEREHGK
jgi:hypothetical protein